MAVNSHRRLWTEEDDAQLRAELTAGVSPDEIARNLERSVSAVRSRANFLGLPLGWTGTRRRSSSKLL